MLSNREKWNSYYGFLFAAIGAAVGNAMAGGFVCCGVEMEAEEAAEVENATMTNQTADGNMTGTNSSG